MEREDEIVGHKTFATGETCSETGFPKMRHESLRRGEAEALWNAAKQAEKERAEKMPDEASAIRALWDAQQRLKELGWREAMYCPKDGTHFKVIEIGSTGIHDCFYSGEWPNGCYLLPDQGDLWPSKPALFRLYPEDEAKEKARMEDARAALRAAEQERG